MLSRLLEFPSAGGAPDHSPGREPGVDVGQDPSPVGAAQGPAYAAKRTSSALPGLGGIPAPTHASRRALPPFAAPRLDVVAWLLY